MRQIQDTSRVTGVGQLERFALAVVDASSNVAIDTLDQAQKVLDHADLLAKRLVTIKHRSDRFADESRQVFKQQALEVSRDVAELSIEAVRQAGSVVRAALEEVREIGQSGESLLKELLEPTLELPNPFRQRPKAGKKSKEPTIIPISIQDN